MWVWRERGQAKGKGQGGARRCSKFLRRVGGAYVASKAGRPYIVALASTTAPGGGF
jgi:hypothetical protein